MRKMLLRLASTPAMLSALHSTTKSGFARDQPRPASRPLPPFPVCPGSVLPLEHLEQVQAAAADFAAAAFIALGGSGTSAAGSSSSSGLPPADFAAVQQRILAPVEEALLQYGDRELTYLTAELARLAAQGEP